MTVQFATCDLFFVAADLMNDKLSCCPVDFDTTTNSESKVIATALHNKGFS